MANQLDYSKCIQNIEIYVSVYDLALLYSSQYNKVHAKPLPSSVLIVIIVITAGILQIMSHGCLCNVSC